MFFEALGVGLAAAIAPLAKKYLTAPLRRAVKNRLKDGPIKRVLLTPLGYTKAARDSAANAAMWEDYSLAIKDIGSKRRGSDS
jgi:hypothetical protein